MSSLILVSPRKTGKIVDGVLDGSKFTQLSRMTPASSQLGLVVHNIHFYGGHFLMQQHSAGARYYLFDDPTQGIGDPRNADLNLNYRWGYGSVNYGDDGATLIACDGFSAANQIAVSYDFGYSWTLVNTGASLAYKSAAKATLPDGTQVWLAFGGSIRRSYDNGASWAAVTAPTSGLNSASNGSRIVTGVGQNLYYTDNGGTTWIKATATFPSGRSVVNQTNSLGYSFIRYVGNRWFVFMTGTTGDWVMTSTDGTTWTATNVPSLGVQLVNVFYAEGVYFMLGLNVNSYLISTDAVNWTVNYFPGGWMSGGTGAYGNGKFIFGPYGSSNAVPYQIYSWY